LSPIKSLSSTHHFLLAKTRHVPVLWREVLEQLDLSRGLSVVDGTVGAGGHSEKISQLLGDEGILIGLDRDPWMLEFARQRVFGHNRHLLHSSYLEIQKSLKEVELPAVDRILLDLGLSSDQLSDPARGFGYSVDAPLDMRFDVSSGSSVKDLLTRLSEPELERILTTYGEERFSPAIAQAIVAQRVIKPIETTVELAKVIDDAIPTKFKQNARREPATRVFQALRIAANEELQHLEQALKTELYEALAPGGRLVVITFHSLEDRLVKNAFKDTQLWEPLTKKPITPTPAEQRMNPRSRSAKLRTAVKK
jgi:16S rRNA (cytosine1402-N4)-methyltransferase